MRVVVEHNFGRKVGRSEKTLLLLSFVLAAVGRVMGARCSLLLYGPYFGLLVQPWRQ